MGLFFSATRAILPGQVAVFPESAFLLKGGRTMVKMLFAMLFASLLAFSTAAPMAAQESAKKGKKESARWEGNVIRSSAEKSTLDVRTSGAVVTQRQRQGQRTC